jgi:hypothetical protein
VVRSFSCLTVFVIAAAGAGCMQAPASEPTGYITVPLTAPGPGGVSYRLPADAGLSLTQPGLTHFFGLDPDATSQTVEVPSGDWSVSLTDLAGDTTIWPLTRVNPDGTTEVIQALLDLTPTITVVDHQTTSLVIRFHVPAIGPITFHVGSIAISVEVDETPATAFDFTITAPSLTASIVFVGNTAPAALAPRLPAQDSTGDGYTATAHTIGPWSFVVSDVVCAPVSASISATGNQGFVELVAEAPPTDFEELCIQQIGPQQAMLEMSFFRNGTATTPLLSDLGDQQYFVGHELSIQVAANLFDGFTLDLRPLAGAHSGSLSVFGIITNETATPDGAPLFDSWYNLLDSGDSTVTLTGR